MKKAPTREDFAHKYPNVGFYRTEHHEALKKWVKEAEKEIKELQYYKDTTIGLWCTDRPDLINDPKEILFQLED